MGEFHSIGISRHRIATDGEGVTTLVAGHGCPLDCKYCLNPQCKREAARLHFSAAELYERLAVDDLYFTATGGGVTFGGGEPLLQAEFIAEFIGYTRSKGKEWRFCVESCLSVDSEKLALLDGLIDCYIVDIKDMNSEIYKKYTGRDIEKLLNNLEKLKSKAQSVLLRLPLIPEYNTEADVDYSKDVLKKLGFFRFDRFTYITEIKK